MKLPTRDQARRIASDKCEDGNRCDECDIAEWCGADLKYTMRLGQVAVALYDEIDKRDDLIRRMKEEANAAGTNDGGTVPNGAGAGTGQNGASFDPKHEE